MFGKYIFKIYGFWFNNMAGFEKGGRGTPDLMDWLGHFDVILCSIP